MRIARAIAVRLTILAVVWLVLCVPIGIFAARSALNPGRNPVSPAAELRAQSIAALDHASLDEVSVQAADGATLRGWSLEPATRNGSAVILLHGQSDNRAGLLGTAHLLLRRGYSVLLPDARAHGSSGGRVATYGVLETGDLRQWVGWIKQKESPRCLFGIGDSMGAAQLLGSLPSIPEWCAVVAESSFASFREAAYLRISQPLGADPWVARTLLRPVAEEGFLYARLRYGISLASASPENGVASSRVPVLLIHGLADTNIPPTQSEEIKAHAAAAGRPVELWEPPGAEHCGAAQTAPDEYQRRVLDWFSSHEPR